MLVLAAMLFSLAAVFHWARSRPSLDSPGVSIPILALLGAGVAAYLTYVEFFVLETICIWCVSLAAVITLSFLISVADIVAGDEEALDAA